MEGLIVDVISKLGVAGFAIFIMYRFHLNYMQAAEKEKAAYTVLLERTITVIQENTTAFREVLKHIRDYEQS